ncbi:MAG: type I methionyl aminopeptidase [Candidatus Pacebacteria bacterium]|jgi:methionyl aminopeptidase|nr:type I methionyl aminopeptidase [Candidatus Paceibacterota bacterium]|tara:strand:+ start:14883 stop:15650 length:768 start_codon:yes stop_codon:yes gene_type:complete
MVKTKEEIEIMREGGKRLAFVLGEVVKLVKPDVDAKELNNLAEKFIREKGDEPSFLGYTPEGTSRSYPSTLCVSVNDEVVHGISNEGEKILHKGDIVGLDLGLKHKELFVDMAVTVGVGNISEKDRKLINTAEEALNVGIKAARTKNTIGDIGYAIEQFVRPYGYGIPYELGGHGVGHKVSEEPYIPNFGQKKEGLELKAGMTLAIEPMLNLGDGRIVLAKDGYTYKTADGKKSAHFEHTILITDGDAEVLTKIQ